ncbi:MAG: hypothetical protein EOO22_00810 [Comamonadaceae bacterium]|nr:MAG: hypothetical protein EOO22_00810 [Comamonadaceae bacterium]
MTPATQSSDPQASADDPWVLLWSQTQNAFHVERLAEMLEANRRAYTEDRRMDYVPLVVGKAQEVGETADACRATLFHRANRADLQLGA